MTSFHYSKEPPPDSVFSDIQALNKFSDDQYNQLVAIIFSLLVDPGKASKVLSQVEDFSKEHGVSASALKNVVRSFLIVPNAGLKKNLTAEQIQEDLTTLGLQPDRATHFGDLWRGQQSSLSKSALGQMLMVNQLVDMEWKFGVTASSNEVNKIGSTFLQLKLVINKGNHNENMYMELTLPQFYNFLHEMEKAKASLEYFS